MTNDEGLRNSLAGSILCFPKDSSTVSEDGCCHPSSLVLLDGKSRAAATVGPTTGDGHAVGFAEKQLSNACRVDELGGHAEGRRQPHPGPGSSKRAGPL